MFEIVKAKHIQILDRVDSWESAVKLAAEPLLKGDYIEPRYVDAIFENTKKWDRIMSWHIILRCPMRVLMMVS